MAGRTDNFRDRIAAVLALTMLAAAGIAAFSLLTAASTDATSELFDGIVDESPSDTTLEQVADRDGSGGDEAPQLRINVSTPTALAVDAARPVLVDVTTTDGTPIPGDTPLAVRATIDTREDLAGYLAVTPRQATTTAYDLRMSKLEIVVTPGAACDVTSGTLRIRVAELDGETRQGEHEVELPDIACPTQLPEPSEALHMTDPVCGKEDPEEGDHAEELRAMLDGEDQEETWCMSTEQARELGIIAERRPSSSERRSNGANGNGDDEDDGSGDDDGDDGDDDNGDDGEDDDGNGNGDNGNGNGDNGNGNGNGNGDNGDDDGNGNGDNGDGNGDGDGDNGGGNGNDGGNGGNGNGNGGDEDDGDAGVNGASNGDNGDNGEDGEG